MSLRIGMFCSSLPEPGLKPGGVDVLIERLANHLVERGNAVRMHSFSPAPAGFLADHVQLEPARWRRSSVFRMTLASVVFNGVSLRGLDVLHLHGEDWFFLRRRLPTVRTFYGSARDEARRATSAKRRAAQTVFYGLELLASRLSTANYGLIPGDGAAYGTQGALGCGVDLPAAVPAERSPRPSVLFVGTWEGRKRGRLLFEAFERDVLPRHPDAELWMVSDHAPAHPAVTHFARPSDGELRDLYARAWVFCLPSSYEGFGIPYIEAMAAGTPVVATPNPGADYLLGHGRFGRLVDDAGLGAAIERLLADPRERDALRSAGRERAEAFSWDSVAAAHEAAYRAAIAAKGRA